MRSFLTNVPLFLPGVILAVLLAAVFAKTVARWLGINRGLAIFGIVGLGVIISATLTPGTEAIVSGVPSDGRCDLTRVGLIPLSELMRVNEASLNVLLFVPLGIAVGLLPWSRRSAVVLAAAVLLPFLIEITQALIPAFGRGCESTDMANNLTGLVIGFAIGGLARMAVTSR